MEIIGPNVVDLVQDSSCIVMHEGQETTTCCRISDDEFMVTMESESDLCPYCKNYDCDGSCHEEEIVSEKSLIDSIINKIDDGMKLPWENHDDNYIIFD